MHRVMRMNLYLWNIQATLIYFFSKLKLNIHYILHKKLCYDITKGKSL